MTNDQVTRYDILSFQLHFYITPLTSLNLSTFKSMFKSIRLNSIKLGSLQLVFLSMHYLLLGDLGAKTNCICLAWLKKL